MNKVTIMVQSLNYSYDTSPLPHVPKKEMWNPDMTEMAYRDFLIDWVNIVKLWELQKECTGHKTCFIFLPNFC